MSSPHSTDCDIFFLSPQNIVYLNQNKIIGLVILEVRVYIANNLIISVFVQCLLFQAWSLFLVSLQLFSIVKRRWALKQERHGFACYFCHIIIVESRLCIEKDYFTPNIIKNIWENVKNIWENSGCPKFIEPQPSFQWISPYFQKYTKNIYVGKVLAKSNISGFIVNGNADLLFIKYG